MCQKSLLFIDAFICYKQKCKVASFNLAHPVVHAAYLFTLSYICTDLHWSSGIFTVLVFAVLPELVHMRRRRRSGKT